MQGAKHEAAAKGQYCPRAFRLTGWWRWECSRLRNFTDSLHSGFRAWGLRTPSCKTSGLVSCFSVPWTGAQEQDPLPFFTLLYWGDKNHPMLFSRDPNTIFRGNSLTSKCIDETMKLAGMHYLHVTLKPTIEEVGQGPEAPALLGGGRGVSPGAHMPA